MNKFTGLWLISLILDMKLLYPDLTSFPGRQKLLLVGCLSVFSTALDRRMYTNLDGILDVDDISTEERARLKAGRVALWQLLKCVAQLGYARADAFGMMDGVPKRLKLPVYTMCHFARCFYKFAVDLESESPETRLAHIIPSAQLKEYLVQDFVNFAGVDYQETFEKSLSSGDLDDFIFSEYDWISDPGSADDIFIAEELPMAPRPTKGGKSVSFMEKMTRLTLKFEAMDFTEQMDVDEDSHKEKRRVLLTHADRLKRRR